MTAAGDVTRDRILGAIEVLAKRHGYSPTIREIADEVGLSKSAVYKHLTALRSAGRVSCPRPGAGWFLT